MIRRPPRSTHLLSSAASDVYKRQVCVCVRACVRVCVETIPTRRVLESSEVCWPSCHSHSCSGRTQKSPACIVDMPPCVATLPLLPPPAVPSFVRPSTRRDLRCGLGVKGQWSIRQSVIRVQCGCLRYFSSAARTFFISGGTGGTCADPRDLRLDVCRPSRPTTGRMQTLECRNYFA